MVAAFPLTTLLFASAINAKLVVERNDGIDGHPPLLKSQLTRQSITPTYRLVEHDRRRHGNHGAKSLQGLDYASGINTPTENQPLCHTATVGLGDPPTNYTFQIDSGSANTWVGANKTYVVTKTSHPTPNNVSVLYGLGCNFSGTEFIDQVTIGSGLVIVNQSIGVASISYNSQGTDGILGIGPAGLSNHTLNPAKYSTIPTVTDNLFSTKVIKENLVSAFFAPLTNTSGEQRNGELTWGGVDTNNYVGSITYAPITETFPANLFWGINASINYGATAVLSNSAGIVDSCTTAILLAPDAFNIYQNATGAVLDPTTQLLTITSTQYKQLQNLSFSVSDVVFDLIPNAQIWPRALNTVIGGVDGKIYLAVCSSGSGNLNTAVSFTLGLAFHERFYSVYDTGNQRVGLAKTPFTYATSN